MCAMTMLYYAIFRLATTVFGEDQKEARLWLERLDGLKSLEDEKLEGLERLEERLDKPKRLEEGELDKLEEERKQEERLEE